MHRSIQAFPFGGRLHQLSVLLLGLALVFGLASCSGDDDDGDFNFAGGGQTGGSDAAAYAGRMEVPALKKGNLFIEHASRVGSDMVMTYCLEYDTTRCHARWVAFRFDDLTRPKPYSRSNEPFADDPSLPVKARIGAGTFPYPYHRGHICASADRLYGEEANIQTFYMTNMSPQIGNFNSGYWTTFEGYVQRKGRDKDFSDTLYVVKGGTIDTGKTLGTVSRSNGKKVTVPKYYFMALLKVKNGAYSALGFLMEHKDYGYDFYHQAPRTVLAEKAVSIDELEEFTKIDFFPNLPDAVETVVESINPQAIARAWDLL